MFLLEGIAKFLRLTALYHLTSPLIDEGSISGIEHRPDVVILEVQSRSIAIRVDFRIGVFGGRRTDGGVIPEQWGVKEKNCVANSRIHPPIGIREEENRRREVLESEVELNEPLPFFIGVGNRCHLFWSIC